MRIDAMLVLAGLGASAQAHSWVWMADVPDGTVLGPGDSITVTLSAAFDSGGGEEVQVLAAAVFDTLNVEGAELGVPFEEGDWTVLHDLDELTGDLTTTDGASLYNINAAQLPFEGFFKTDANPVDILQFTWTVVDEPVEGMVSFTTSTAFAKIWVGPSLDDVELLDLGDFITETTFGWQVIPAPACAMPLVFGGVALARRRRLAESSAI
jgi:hypothetical protein